MMNSAPSLKLRAAAELELRRRERIRSMSADSGDVTDWQGWLRTVLPKYVSSPTGEPIPFAPRHEELWSWVWSIKRGERPRPFVAIWPRGGGKSTTAEMACAALAVRGARKYGLYICEGQ